MIRALLMSVLICSPAWAETVIAARTIPAKALIGPGDVLLNDSTVLKCSYEWKTEES